MPRKNRQKARFCILRLQAHRDLSHDDIRSLLTEAKGMIRDPNVDPRTRSILLKFLVDHDWAVYEHENPAEQKLKIDDVNIRVTIDGKTILNAAS